MANQEMFVRNPFESTLGAGFERVIPYGIFSRDYAVRVIEKEMKLPRHLASYHFTDAISQHKVIRIEK